MTEDHDSSTAPLEAALSAREASEADDWEGIRLRLARRVADEGLLDVAFERHDTPLGPVLIGATANGLVRIGLPGEDEHEIVDELAQRLSVKVLRAPRDSITQARGELDEYFDRRRTRFAAPLDWQLTRGFRREVLRATAQIPYGQTMSYSEVASKAGRPAAVRAAGTALATNPLPIVVPCHRVLRTGGQLGSYRGGTQAKASLLELEAASPPRWAAPRGDPGGDQGAR